MTEKLFVYGTFLQPDVRKRIIKREVKSTPDTLLGFRKSTVKIDGCTYPIIEEDPGSDEEIKGLVLDIEQEDLDKIDEYETDAYRRERVTLESGISAWAYRK